VKEHCDKNYRKFCSSAFISKNGKLGRYVPYFNRGKNVNCKWAYLETKNSEKYQDLREMKEV
jgi:hypothetical protein